MKPWINNMVLLIMNGKTIFVNISIKILRLFKEAIFSFASFSPRLFSVGNFFSPEMLVDCGDFDYVF